MKQRRIAAVAAVLAVFVLTSAGCSKKEEGAKTDAKPSASSSVNMQEGKWEITSSFEMQGMPAGMMQPQTVTTCLNKTDYVPKGEDQKDCTMKDVNVSGNTVTWSMVCKDSTAKGQVTYAGTTFDGMTEMVMKQDGKDQTMKMTMKGKHIGPCN
ncbi:MAG: DUF3617 family protein [Thermodesulfovibrionales bacterium]